MIYNKSWTSWSKFPVPLLLRKIRRNKWKPLEEALTGPLKWLDEGELQADVLQDLKTDQNRLSVWSIDDNRTNLERIITALAVSCDSLQNVEYVLLDWRILDEVGIAHEDKPGDCPDTEANVRWHRDLVKLTVNQVAALAQAMLVEGQIKRCNPTEYRQTLENLLNDGKLSLEMMREGVKQRLSNMGLI